MPSLNWSTIARWISCHGVCDAGTGKPPAGPRAPSCELCQLFVADQHVGGTFVEVDPHPVTGLDQGEPPPAAASGEALRIDGEPEVPDWRPSPTQASQWTPSLISAAGALHVDDLGGARVADRPGAADEEHAVLVDVERRVPRYGAW